MSDKELAEQLGSSINICASNNTEFIPFKKLFAECLSKFVFKFKEYGMDPDYDNFCSRLSNLKVNYNNQNSKIVTYDFTNNIIEINTELVKGIEGEEELEKVFCESILGMFTYVYNIETDSSNKGITFSLDGKNYFEFINKKMDERVIELFFGNSESDNDRPLSLPTAADQITCDMQLLIGSENMFTYYLNGRGDLFFNKLSELFNNNQECVEFIEEVDSLKDPNPKKEEKYYIIVENLVKKRKSLSDGNLSF